jgi:hypothetical protein
MLLMVSLLFPAAEERESVITITVSVLELVNDLFIHCSMHYFGYVEFQYDIFPLAART